MRADVFAPADLPGDLLAAWRSIQRSCPTFAGPCFHPRLYRTLAGHVQGVKVAALTHDSGALAFLPYVQPEGTRAARPVPACDYQGIIGDPSLCWDVREILERLGLVAWDFENLVAFGMREPPRVASRSRSPRVTLDGHGAAYAIARRKPGHSGRNLRTHRRLLQRNHGTVRFEADVRAPAALHLLMQWKAARFGGFADWARLAMEDIHGRADEDFSGVLSVLSAGDAIIAAHFGLRCDGIQLYWFPGFDPQFARYSAGRLLLEDLIAALPAQQCRALDLGPGGEAYKDYFANDAIEVSMGSFEVPSVRAAARALKRGALGLLNNPVLRRAARPVVRALRRVLGRRRPN